jgi:MOSC domain-containing protein YiiM
LQNIRITSVNVGRAEELTFGRQTFTTGIRKRPVTDSVRISLSAVGDDAICDTQHHGGPDQAVYVYSVEDYRWWSEQLGREMIPGTFGENLTISGLDTELYIGDRLLIGDVVLEATSPRIPCATLAARMEDRSFGIAFRRAERPGVYFRVMNEGDVRVGDPVVLVDTPQRQVSVGELFRFAFELSHNENDLRRYLDAPIAERMRLKIESKLPAQGVSPSG